MKYDAEKERFVMDLPEECPRCGAELELDTRYVGDGETKTFLLCSNDECDYELDASEEFERASEEYNIKGDDEDDDDIDNDDVDDDDVGDDDVDNDDE